MLQKILEGFPFSLIVSKIIDRFSSRKIKFKVDFVQSAINFMTAFMTVNIIYHILNMYNRTLVFLLSYKFLILTGSI